MKNLINEITILGQKFIVNEPLDSSVAYIIGVSVCDREDRASYVTITHPVNMAVIAVYRSEFIEVDDLACILMELVKDFIPNSTICVIRNSTGLLLLKYIIKMINGNVFYERREDGSIKQYGVDAMKTDCFIDLNNVLGLPNIDKDGILALSAAAYVYNKKVEVNKKSDVVLYPSKNTSFINMAEYLKNKGIKNYDFMLELKNKDLLNIDPYDPNLSEQMKMAIVQECKQNPWYFFREVLRIEEMDGNLTNFKLNRGNVAMMWLFFKGIDTLTYLSSCTGKTIAGISLVAYVMLFDNGNRAIVGSRRTYNSIRLLSRMANIYELLPEYIKTGIQVSYSAKNNLFMHNDYNDTNVEICKAYYNKHDAENVAREINAPVQFFDDIDFIDNFDTLYTHSSVGYNVVKNDAMFKDQYHARILTSVPGNLDIKSAQFADKLFNGAVLFDESMYDMSLVELITHINISSMNGLVAINMNYLDLGKSQEWYSERCRHFNNNEDTIRRELLLERYAGSVADKDSAKVSEEFNDTIIEIKTSKTIKDKLNQIAKQEGVDINMLINQMIGIEIGKFGK